MNSKLQSIKNLGLLPIILLLVPIALYQIKYLDYVIGFLNNHYLVQINEEYLRSSEIVSSKTLLILGSIRSGLSVLESGVAGVSFIIEAKVQIGKVVEPLKSILEYASTTSLLSLAGFIIIDILLKTTQLFSEQILSLSILSLSVYHISRSYKLFLEDFARRISSSMILLVAFIHLIAPLVVYTTGNISQKIILPMKDQHHEHLEEMRALFAVESEQKIGDQVKSVVTHGHKLSDNIAQKSHDISKHVVRYFVCMLFETFILPVSLFLAMTWVFQLMITLAMEKET